MSFDDPISRESGSQSNFSSGLYIVATPIGNLRDITLRAIDTLRVADRILAEDTRQTRKLLSAYNIDTPLTAYHDHNVAKMLPRVLEWLEKGEIIAQVSDAGTPLVSDPGFKLVRSVVEAGYKVTPLPGASAPLAALVAAGLPTDRFLFAGFLPSKTKARQSALEEIARLKATLIFFESGKRIVGSLTDMRSVLGDRPAALARELTKTYEEVRRGTISELIASAEEIPPRGEIVLIIGPAQTAELWSAEEVDQALNNILTEQGAKRASTEIAGLSGWAKRDIYQRALALSKGSPKRLKNDG